jgi:hypothetical protein
MTCKSKLVPRRAPKRIPRAAIIVLAALFPFLSAAKGEGCGGGDDEVEGGGSQITPNVSGEWAITWENNLDVEITIGGAVYTESFGAQGGIMDIDHNGTPISFDLDCSRPAVVCPSEVFADSASLAQSDVNFPRNVYVTVPTSVCGGNLVDADPAECGAGTNNEDCNQVCDGEITLGEAETFGRITLPNDELIVLLGATVASNGVNCALLGLSVARADLETTGSKSEGNWEAMSMPAADVITGFAGGCLWAGDVNDDGSIEAIAVGAAVKFTTSFTAQRQ